MRIFLSVSLLFIPSFTFAATPSDVRVTGVVFSTNFDTASITLSEAVPNNSIRYDLSVDGEIRRGGSFAATDGKVTVQSGFRRDFLNEGGMGTYTLEFQACPQDETTILDVLKYCGPKYSVTVNFMEHGGFSDVPFNHLNAEAIDYVQANGIVSGYSDGTYRPNQTINRAEFTKIIIKGNFSTNELESCDKEKFIHFSDVHTDAWYAPYLCIAVQYHVNGGYPDGTFRPDANVNFVEAAKMMIGALIREGEAGPSYPGMPWYEPFVNFLSSTNAIPLSIQSLDHTVTRGEMAEMIYRLKAEIIDKPSRTYEELVFD